MTPAQANLLRANSLAILAPGSGVLRDGVREALAAVDAETARGLNAPRVHTPHVHVTENAKENPGVCTRPLAALCANNPDDAGLVREAIWLAVSNCDLGLDGVDATTITAEVIAVLQEIGVDVGQGAPAPVDTVVAEVRAEFLTRSEGGIAKYGVTLDRTDLGIREWLVHFREELMDGVLYATRALRDLPAAVPVEPPHAAAPFLRPLTPEPAEAVLGRAGEALAWDGQQLPVWVEYKPGAKHPYGDEAFYVAAAVTPDGMARLFPCMTAAHRWLAAMGKAPA